MANDTKNTIQTPKKKLLKKVKQSGYSINKKAFKKLQDFYFKRVSGHKSWRYKKTSMADKIILLDTDFAFELLHKKLNPLFGHFRIGRVEINIQQVNEPGSLYRVEYIGVNDLAGNR